MTAPSVTVAPRPVGRDGRTTVLITVAVVLASLVLGYLLRMAIESGTTSVSQGGISADAPSGWVVTPAAGGSAFSAFDPRSAGTAFSASIAPGTDAESAARVQLAQDQALRDGFTELDAVPVRLDGRDGFRIDYAFVESEAVGGLPVVLRGVAVFLVDGEEVIGLTYEATADEFDDGLDRFFRFAQSARAAP